MWTFMGYTLINHNNCQACATKNKINMEIFAPCEGYICDSDKPHKIGLFIGWPIFKHWIEDKM